jgi:hypothetical protein
LRLTTKQPLNLALVVSESELNFLLLFYLFLKLKKKQVLFLTTLKNPVVSLAHVQWLLFCFKFVLLYLGLKLIKSLLEVEVVLVCNDLHDRFKILFNKFALHLSSKVAL